VCPANLRSSSRQDYEPLQLQLPSLQQLPAWLAGFLQAPAVDTDKAAAHALSSGNTSSAAVAVRSPAGAVAAFSSNTNTSRARFPPVLRQQQQQDADVTTISSSSGVQLLGEMLNLKSTFPMLLGTVSGTSSSSSSSSAAEAGTVATGPASTSAYSSSSSVSGRPQQLLTVGCRNWGNWWDGRGLLRVKIYDFAIYVDGEQVCELLPCNKQRTIRI
jgi:hypothetical protein